MTNYLNLDPYEYEDIMFGGDTENFEIIEDGDFVSEGKYEHKESVVRHKETGKYYSVFQSRTGSYFTDYHFEDDLEAVSEELICAAESQ